MMRRDRFGEKHGRKPVFGVLEPRVLLSANGELVESTPELGSGDGAVVDMTDEGQAEALAAADEATVGVDGSGAPSSDQEGQTEPAMAPVAGPAIESAAEAVSQPVGEAKGIYPGRVAWVHDPAATSWDGSTGHWWDDANTDPAAVESMFSNAIRWLTGQESDAAAWSALFGHFNLTRLGENVGYTPGQKIAVKANLNNVAYGHSDTDNAADTSPQVVMALLRSLVYDAGVSPADIALYDVSRFIPDRLYDRIAAEFPQVQCVDKSGGNGRIRAEVDEAVRVHYSDIPDELDSYLPTVVTEADYLINLANLKKHGQAGITLTGKNHFGSIATLARKWTPIDLHPYTYLTERVAGSANPIVDLMGHEHLGGKTLLHLIDGLYGASNNAGSLPAKWRTLGDHWSSSLLVSQDPVAVDSVGSNILEAEWSWNGAAEGSDEYLHHAATANEIRSWGSYDPAGDGTGLASLGTHEHWNNNVDRQYSRNLGTGAGIELVTEDPGVNVAPTVNITNPAAGADLPSGVDVAIAAAATDPDGTVTKVEFYANGQYIGVDADPAEGWGAVWTDPAAGDWALTAKAFDNAGGSSISQAVNIRVSPYPGDFNSDGVVDADDIDALAGAILAGTNDPMYDLTGEPSPVVDQADMNELVHNLVFVNGDPWTRGTEYGNANLDGLVNDDDLSLLLSNWGALDVGWALGDFTGDGQINDDDLSVLLSNWHPGTPAITGEITQTAALQVGLVGDASAPLTGEPVTFGWMGKPVALGSAGPPATAALVASLPATSGQNPPPASPRRRPPGLSAPKGVAGLDDDLVDLLGEIALPLRPWRGDSPRVS